jgi:hypothetical protein
MIKFLTSRDLLFLSDFSSTPSPSPVHDYATVDIGHILATLKQVPSYQIDTNHTNCGLRTRVLPVLEYVQAMLASNVVAVARQAWRRDREGVAWGLEAYSSGGEEERKKKKEEVFCFTRSVATDQRLRYEGAMAADRMARALFTAGGWDWTPETRDEGRGAEFGRWRLG